MEKKSKIFKLLEKWCDENRFYELQVTNDDKFAIANSLKVNLLVKDKNFIEFSENEENLLYRKAYKSGRRQIWYVEVKKNELIWTLF